MKNYLKYLNIDSRYILGKRLNKESYFCRLTEMLQENLARTYLLFATAYRPFAASFPYRYLVSLFATLIDPRGKYTAWRKTIDLRYRRASCETFLSTFKSKPLSRPFPFARD